MEEQVDGDSSSPENVEVEAGTESDEQPQLDGRLSPEGNDSTPSSQPQRPSIPVQKRRRVTRACDECRRKKIKCDGKQPCTHCTVYSYECTYDQPSHRRRNPAPQYVEALEQRLQRAEALLHTVLPDVNLDDPQSSTSLSQRILPKIKQESRSQDAFDRDLSSKRDENPVADEDSMLESMVQNAGSLDIDDRGHWDFHGSSSGIVFLRALRDQFGDLMGQAEGYGMPFLKTMTLSSTISSPKSTGSGDSPTEAGPPNTEDLPHRECAVLLSECALDDACTLMRFVHQPTFWAKFDRAYDTPPDQYGDSETRFLPLLYSVCALGSLFAKADKSKLQKRGYENAIDQGFTWFNAARSMMDVTDCPDLTALQTVLFMIIFLQSSSRLSTCYSHIGVVLRSSVRMGLHRSVAFNFNPIEKQIRQRIFWTVRNMDAYVSCLLGMPYLLSHDDVDQEMPCEVDDEYITSEKILPMPEGHLSLITAFNAHTRLVNILSKIKSYIYPIKIYENRGDRSYAVSHEKVREVEQDLQQWLENLPMALRPGGAITPAFTRVQQLLRMAYGHIQMFLYRPFLHYISQKLQAKSIDKRSYACAAACVSVSRNVIQIAGEMKKRGLLNGSYWFYMYTTFFSILSLVFFVIENPASPTAKEILRDAYEGRDTLASLAKRSMAADKCTKTLARLFEQLPEKLKGVPMTQTSRKKRQVSTTETSGPTKPAQTVPDAPAKRRTPDMPKASDRRPDSLHNLPDLSHGSRKPVSEANDGSSLSSQPLQRPSQGLDARLGGFDPYSPNQSNTQVPDSASGTPSSSGWPTFGSSQPFTAEIPNLQATMFPSSDPLAYPNQPLSTFEDQHFGGQDNLFNQNLLDPNSRSPATTSPSVEAQLFGPIPPYLMQGQDTGFGFQQMNFPMPMTTAGEGDSAMALDHNEGTWDPQDMQDPHYGQRFRDDWGQPWMNRGFGQ